MIHRDPPATAAPVPRAPIADGLRALIPAPALPRLTSEQLHLLRGIRQANDSALDHLRRANAGGAIASLEIQQTLISALHES